MLSLLEDPATLRVLLIVAVAMLMVLAILSLGWRRARLVAESRCLGLELQLSALGDESRALALRAGQHEARLDGQSARLSELAE